MPLLHYIALHMFSISELMSNAAECDLNDRGLQLLAHEKYLEKLKALVL